MSLPKHIQPPERKVSSDGSQGFIGGIKHYILVKRIIASNRRFFIDFYFRRHLPETVAQLTAEGEWIKKLECISDARATKSNLLESIEEATALAERSIQTVFIKNLAVRALRRELKRYSTIAIPGSTP